MDARALHLHRHPTTVLRRRLVYLCEGRRCERRRAERLVQRLRRRPQRLRDDRANVVVGEGPNLALKLRKLVLPLEWQRAPLTRKDLAQLDVGRPEVLQQEPDLDLRRKRRDRHRDTPEPFLHRAADRAQPCPVEDQVDGVLQQDPVELHHPQTLRDARDCQRALAARGAHGRVVQHRRRETEDAVEEEPDHSRDDGADEERHDALDLEHRRQGEQREQDRVDRDHDQPERLQDVWKEQKLERGPYQGAEDAEDGGKPQDREKLVRRMKLEAGQEQDQQPDDDRVRDELDERDPPVETRQRSTRRHVWHTAGHRPDSTHRGRRPFGASRCRLSLQPTTDIGDCPVRMEGPACQSRLPSVQWRVPSCH